MAKKNIISDFSALKGKVTFSEQSSVVPWADGKGIGSGKSSKKLVGQECAASLSGLHHDEEQIDGKVLKVGQKVVLMVLVR